MYHQPKKNAVDANDNYLIQCPVCDRKKRRVLCKNCGFKFIGRIKTVCPTHPATRFLMDLHTCPQCTTDSSNMIEEDPDSQSATLAASPQEESITLPEPSPQVDLDAQNTPSPSSSQPPLGTPSRASKLLFPPLVVITPPSPAVCGTPAPVCLTPPRSAGHFNPSNISVCVTPPGGAVTLPSSSSNANLSSSKG